jgi:nucleotide-binding universal stress UspA family protein
MDRPMEHPPTILVPLDGSSYGEAILATVAALARPLRARVVLLLVGDPALEPTIPLSLTAGGARAGAGSGHASAAAAPAAPTGKARTGPGDRLAVEQVLRGYLARCAEELPTGATACVVDFADDPAAVIIARARQEHADLIAMATHGRTGLGQLLAGSVCETVIRSGVAPVVVLRPCARGGRCLAN